MNSMFCIGFTRNDHILYSVRSQFSLVFKTDLKDQNDNKEKISILE